MSDQDKEKNTGGVYKEPEVKRSEKPGTGVGKIDYDNKRGKQVEQNPDLWKIANATTPDGEIKVSHEEDGQYVAKSDTFPSMGVNPDMSHTDVDKNATVVLKEGGGVSLHNDVLTSREFFARPVEDDEVDAGKRSNWAMDLEKEGRDGNLHVTPKSTDPIGKGK